MSLFSDRDQAASAGSRTSEAKAAASRANGATGGRKPKPLSEIPCTCASRRKIRKAGGPVSHPSSCPRGRALWRRERAKHGARRQ